MKLVKYSLIGIGILMSSLSFGGENIKAAESSTGNSTADFELEKGDASVPGLIDPEIQPPTINEGPLSLDAVSSFNFSKKKLGSESKSTIEAKPVDGTKLGLQVTDERGEDLGWNLKVSATPFKTEDESLELKGAFMTIPKGSLRTKEGVDLDLTPTAFKVVLSTTSESIMTASATQGRSSWVNYFEGEGEKVTLDVPSGNKAAKYHSTISWSLEDAP